MSEPYLSLIIPAYNEESRIRDTLEKVAGYLGAQDYTWEVVVVDDGSTDDTAALVTSFAADYTPNVRLIAVAHGGKGWAVKQGMVWTTGQYRFICDADLSMPVEHISRFLVPEIADFDIAIGSREIKGARRIGEPFLRHLMGRIFNLQVRVLALSGFQDTQCGFKCFRGQFAQELFGVQRLHGFAFDVELLFIARKRRLRIKEVAIDWHFRPQSKVRPLHDSLAMTRDILKVRWRNLRGGYKNLEVSTNKDPV